MSHYFIYNEDRIKKTISIEGYVNNKKYSLFTDEGLFSYKHFDFGTVTLLETVEINETHKKVLDLGCGYGLIGIVLKLENPQLVITQTDINQRAMELTKLNNDEKKLNNDVFVSDGFENIKEVFDLIILNPPIKAGKEVIFKMYKEAYEHLNYNGEFYIVIKKAHGAPSHLKYLKEIYENALVISKNKGYYVIKTKKIK